MQMAPLAPLTWYADDTTNERSRLTISRLYVAMDEYDIV